VELGARVGVQEGVLVGLFETETEDRDAQRVHEIGIGEGGFIHWLAFLNIDWIEVWHFRRAA
jgi:hypothetical protein